MSTGFMPETHAESDLFCSSGEKSDAKTDDRDHPYQTFVKSQAEREELWMRSYAKKRAKTAEKANILKEDDKQQTSETETKSRVSTIQDNEKQLLSKTQEIENLKRENAELEKNAFACRDLFKVSMILCSC